MFILYYSIAHTEKAYISITEDKISKGRLSRHLVIDVIVSNKGLSNNTSCELSHVCVCVFLLLPSSSLEYSPCLQPSINQQ